jgi:hypothetical protein
MTYNDPLSPDHAVGMAIFGLPVMRTQRGKDTESGIPMRRDVWIFLFVLGALFFSWPIMSIFENSLVLSLFVIWLLFIVCIFITSIFSEREDGGG